MGDMSIVGPRPLMKEGYDRYDEEIKSKIYNIKPGLTGIGSIISGMRKDNYEFKTKTSPMLQGGDFAYKGEIELWYQKNQNFLLIQK